MKKVFLSSVAIGLEAFRDAAFRAISRLDGYHCVRMEDFGARTGSPQDFCTRAVKSCDIFIGIIGQRYGSCAPDSSMSFTEIEYRAAIEANIPRLMAVAPDDLLVPAHHRESDDTHTKLVRFRREVLSLDMAAFFRSEESLGLAVVTALQNERRSANNEHPGETAARNEIFMNENPNMPDSEKSYLLFPFVSNATSSRNGNFDTGIAIPNTGSDPLGTTGKRGTCTFHYYGVGALGSQLESQTSAIVEPGDTLLYVLSCGSATWGLDGRAQGFTGYVIVECNFPFAHGFAYVHPQGADPLTGGISISYLATRIERGRRSG